MPPNPAATQGVQWVSRTLAVMVFLVAPGFLGGYLDQQLGTRFLTPLGWIAGMIVSTGLLLLLAKQFTPPARGKPLPFDDEESESDSDPD